MLRSTQLNGVGSTRASLRLAAALGLVIALGACASRRPLAPVPEAPVPEVAPLRTETGLASFYGRGFHGKTTASGVPFDRRAPVAAHPRFPFGTRVRVTNLKNGRQMIVTIIDRGPARAVERQGVIIDLSQGAAETLGFIRDGRQRVRVDVLRWGASGR